MWLRSFYLLSFQVLLGQLSGAAPTFQGCDNVYNVNPGVSYLQSPYYPNKYPAGSSCRYKFIAPENYFIEVSCELNIYSSGSACTTENFYLDRDGDLQMRGSENFCGAGTFKRNSAFRSLVLAYISTGSNAGSFQCSLTVKPQACSCGWSAATRIANGQNAGANEYPSMVAIKQIGSSGAFCGGTIISSKHIATAAHCVANRNANSLAVVAGTNNLGNPTASKFSAQYNIQQIIVHEQYQDTLNDIAILVTASTIEWSRGVGPACLPPTGTTDSLAYADVDVIGFGSLFFTGPVSSVLQKIQLMALTNSDCQSEYSSVNAGQLCTYDYTGSHRDSCQYDSGGPVLLRSSRQFLVGIISYGKECAVATYPTGVNTRITYYLSWILKKIGNSNCAQSSLS